MEKRSTLLIFFGLLFLCLIDVGAELDSGIQVMDHGLEIEEQFTPNTLEEEKKNVFLPRQDNLLREVEEGESNSYALPGARSDQEFKLQKADGEKSRSDQGLDITIKKQPKELLQFSNIETIEKNYDKRNSFFTISFYKDSFDYEDDEGLFEQTYRRNGNGKSSEFPGIVRLSLVKYLNVSALDIGWGGAMGLGYNSGRGVFATNLRQSDAKFKLWTIPVDFILAAELHFSKYFKLCLHGGPSVLGLIQNRSDKPEESRDRNTRQVGFGYFASALAKISLSDIFPKVGYKIFSDYNVTKLYLNLEARNHAYGGFKSSDVKVSGTSFGLGFTFEYF